MRKFSKRWPPNKSTKQKNYKLNIPERLKLNTGVHVVVVVCGGKSRGNIVGELAGT